MQVSLLFCCCHFHYHHVRSHLAPCVCCSPCQKTLFTIGSKALACKHLSASRKVGTPRTPMSLSASLFEISNVCNQMVTTVLPFSEGLDDCSPTFFMSSYILFAQVKVHAAPEDVALRGGQRASQLAMGCPCMQQITQQITGHTIAQC